VLPASIFYVADIGLHFKANHNHTKIFSCLWFLVYTTLNIINVIWGALYLNMVILKLLRSRSQDMTCCGEGAPHWQTSTIPFSIFWEQCYISSGTESYSLMTLHLAHKWWASFSLQTAGRALQLSVFVELVAGQFSRSLDMTSIQGLSCVMMVTGDTNVDLSILITKLYHIHNVY
jgi:hypothetical protein